MSGFDEMWQEMRDEDCPEMNDDLEQGRDCAERIMQIVYGKENEDDS